MSNIEVKATKKGDAIELSVVFKTATKDGYEVTCSSAPLIPVADPASITEDLCNSLKEAFENNVAETVVRLAAFMASSRTGEEMKKIADDPSAMQLTIEEMEKLPEMIEEGSDAFGRFLSDVTDVLGDDFVDGTDIQFDFDTTVSDGPVLKP